MITKSTTTLSKKEKSQLKNKEKKQAMIEVIDSDQQHGGKQADNNEERNIGNEKKPQKAEKKVWNIFNLDRLKKYEPQLAPQPISILKFEQDESEYDPEGSGSRTLLSYTYKQSEKKKYISENNFQNRVTLLQQEEKKSKIQAQDDGKSSSSSSSQKQQRRPMRYFDEKKQNEKKITCYRCGEEGHIARNCTQQQQFSCMFCLGSHHHQDCGQKLCFRCNGVGHMSQECKANGVKCRKCRKIGHIEKNCGALQFLDYVEVSDREMRERFSTADLKKVRCMHCQKMGHFNCFQYRTKNNVYRKSKKK